MKEEEVKEEGEEEGGGRRGEGGKEEPGFKICSWERYTILVIKLNLTVQYILL